MSIGSLKRKLRSFETRARKHFSPTLSRERWLEKRALTTVGKKTIVDRSCVAGVAAIPSREEALSQVIDSVIEQFDHLYVYLNGFSGVPAFLKHKKITVFRSQETGDLGDVGKFFGTQYVNSGLYFTLDDDIVYPPDYRLRMETCLHQFDYEAAVGVHGAYYSWHPVSFFDRNVIHYRAENSEIRPVSLLGTGTVAFSLDHFRVDLDWFKSANMADIWFGGQLKRRGFPALCIDRKEGWLKDAQATDPESESMAIYEVTRADPTPYNNALSEFLPWGRSDISRRIANHPALMKRYQHLFFVDDYPQLIAMQGDDAQDLLIKQFDKMALKQCADQDALRYFDSYECSLWSALLVDEKHPDYTLALAVIKRAMPVATEQAAENAEKLMRSAAKRSDRRAMLRAALVSMRAMQRLELFDEVVRSYEYISAQGEPSAQIALENLTALISLGRFVEAVRFFQSSGLSSKYNALHGIVAWLRDPGKEPLLSLVDGYLSLEAAGLVRAFRSNVFRWVAAADKIAPDTVSEAELDDLIKRVLASGDGLSAIKLLVQAGARQVAGQCYQQVERHAGDQLRQTVEFQLMGALVAEPGQKTVNRLNDLYAKYSVAKLEYTHSAVLFEGLSPSIKAACSESFGKVSVIMTCRNASSSIGYAIRSIVEQTYGDLELVVVDDGSSDSTREIVERVSQEDPRVSLIENAENLGIYASRNLAIERSNGDFIAFQDADDYSHPERLELQMKAIIESEGIVASNSGHIRVAGNGEVCLENNLYVFGHGPVNWLYRRAVFDKIGFFKEVRTRGDIEFIRRLYTHYKHDQVRLVDLPLLLAMHDLNTNSWRESQGDKLRVLLRQRESHARQHYVARHQMFGEVQAFA